jgi:hypothetical protein
MSDGRLSRGRSERGAQFPTPRRGATVPDWYPELLASVSTRGAGGQQRAITAANHELLATCWAIGADILARQNQQGWGAKIIDRLSADLRERFPDARGYWSAGCGGSVVRRVFRHHAHWCSSCFPQSRGSRVALRVRATASCFAVMPDRAAISLGGVERVLDRPRDPPT